MKNLKLGISIVLLGILFTSCYTTVPAYSPKIQEIKKESKSNIEKFSVDNVCFNDSLIELCIDLDKDHCYYVLTVKNKTDYKIKILWDEAVIITNGAQSTIIHNGTKFIDKDKTQIPSIILGNTSIVEYFTISNQIYWQNSGQYSHWVVPEVIKSASDKVIISIPLLINDSTFTYTSNLVIYQNGTRQVVNPNGFIMGGILGGIGGGILLAILLSGL